MTDWPFNDPENVAVITTRHVLDARKPILLVAHDQDDGAWQFLCGTTNNSADARVVSLRQIFENQVRDQTLSGSSPLSVCACELDAFLDEKRASGSSSRSSRPSLLADDKFPRYHG